MQRISLLALFVSVLVVNAASAQNWSFDARKVALGSPGGGENLASAMIEEEKEYRAIVLPFGLIQATRDLKAMNPSNDEFDLVRTIEFAASPLHYTIGKDAGGSGSRDFIVDVGNGELSRDLNDYKGFVPVNQPAAGGVANPSWGKTFKVHQGARGAFQGIFAGAGPYFSMRTAPFIDEQLIQIFSAGEAVYVPNSQLRAQDVTQGQLALAVTGGYRGRFAWPSGLGRGSDREGLYVAANYNYLRGFRYENFDLRVRMDTDGNGLLTVNPLLPSPLRVERTNATSGRGMAVDIGVGAVVDHWELGFGASGLGNRIDWSNVERTIYSFDDLVSGGDFNEGDPIQSTDVRVELPVDYRANVAYDVDRWAAVAEFGRGIQGKSFHGGGEYRFSAVEVRGGAVYSRELWNPAAGVGFNMSRRMSLDVAVYGNSANLERKRHPAIAVSLRFNH